MKLKILVFLFLTLLGKVIMTDLYTNTPDQTLIVGTKLNNIIANPVSNNQPLWKQPGIVDLSSFESSDLDSISTFEKQSLVQYQKKGNDWTLLFNTPDFRNID